MLAGFGRSRREAEDGRGRSASPAPSREARVAAPTPAATRAVRCPVCEASFEVSMRAINARCPKCTRPMRFEDAELNGFCTQNVTTMGTVRIGRKGVVRGRIDCGALVVGGQLDGTIRINGCCIVQPRGVLRGEIAARSMVIERGGSLEGSVEIGGGAPGGVRPRETAGGVVATTTNPRAQNATTRVHHERGWSRIDRSSVT